MMSIHFSKIIKAGDRNREFNFTRTNRSGNQYSVNVPDERGNRIFFTMQQEGNSWKTSMDILPAWVLSAEEELSKAIEEENKPSVEKEGRSK
ncbi:MAG TPA: hypothetical protein VM884_05025 [Flavisolibacter sp.]|jgi:hypothetical protein|nr:hypothetical protein [Flavisolibacter sp.]